MISEEILLAKKIYIYFEVKCDIWLTFLNFFSLFFMNVFVGEYSLQKKGYYLKLS